MDESQFTVIDVVKLKSIVNHRLSFQFPLNYDDEKDDRTITVVVNVTQKGNNSQFSIPLGSKLICYLQGGPGFGCSVPLSFDSITKELLDRNYIIVYLDQRGTGLSTPIDSRTIEKLPKESKYKDQNIFSFRSPEMLTLESKFKLILNFRANSIIKDAEKVREALIGENKWSLLGQSYGGFCSFTYLSYYPQSLREVLITGGVPPIGFHPDDVYKSTYQRTAERNKHYFDKYPADSARLRGIYSYLFGRDLSLPNGGFLSVERFQQLGILLGASGGTDNLHQIVVAVDHELKLFGEITYNTLSNIQNQSSFDTNVIYALFQEAIYCEGEMMSNWSADRLRYSPENHYFCYKKDRDITYFTGEMVYKSMFDDYSELRPFKSLAYSLHSKKNWEKLYDEDTLSKIRFSEVPIVAATYVNDQYVDFGLTKSVKNKIFGLNNLRQYITSEFFHNGLRADPAKVIGSLMDLLDCEID